MEFERTRTRMKEASSPQSSTRPTARYTVRFGKASSGDSDWSTTSPRAPPSAAETSAAATPAKNQVASARIGRLVSRRSTRYQWPSSSPSTVAPRNRAPVSSASAPSAVRPLSTDSGHAATSPGATAATPTQRATGSRAYSSTCHSSTASVNAPSQSEAPRPVAPAWLSSPRLVSQASAAHTSTVAPTSLKNPARTTPQSGASHSSPRLPRAVSNSTTVSTPVGPRTWRPPVTADAVTADGESLALPAPRRLPSGASRPLRGGRSVAAPSPPVPPYGASARPFLRRLRRQERGEQVGQGLAGDPQRLGGGDVLDVIGLPAGRGGRRQRDQPGPALEEGLAQVPADDPLAGQHVTAPHQRPRGTHQPAVDHGVPEAAVAVGRGQRAAGQQRQRSQPHPRRQARPPPQRRRGGDRQRAQRQRARVAAPPRGRAVRAERCRDGLAPADHRRRHPQDLGAGRRGQQQRAAALGTTADPQPGGDGDAPRASHGAQQQRLADLDAAQPPLLDGGRAGRHQPAGHVQRAAAVPGQAEAPERQHVADRGGEIGRASCRER